MNPPRLTAGTITTQCALSRRSRGIPLSGAAMISSNTVFASETRSLESPFTTMVATVINARNITSLVAVIRSSFRLCLMPELWQSRCQTANETLNRFCFSEVAGRPVTGIGRPRQSLPARIPHGFATEHEDKLPAPSVSRFDCRHGYLLSSFGHWNKHVAGYSIFTDKCKHELTASRVSSSVKRHDFLCSLVANHNSTSVFGDLQPSVNSLVFHVGVANCQKDSWRNLLGLVVHDFKINPITIDGIGQQVQFGTV